MSPIRSHMAAEGTDADLPTLHQTRLLSDNALQIAVLAAAADVVLKLRDANRGGR